MSNDTIVYPFSDDLTRIHDTAEGLIGAIQNRHAVFIPLRQSEGIDFTDDIPIQVDTIDGVIWDIVVSTDSTDWSMMIFTDEDQIAGASPVGSDMVTWANTYVFTTGAVTSHFFKYQYTDMSPIYLNHMDRQSKNIYIRFQGTITEAYLKMIVSRIR
jgi:hypothetical protein